MKRWLATMMCVSFLQVLLAGCASPPNATAPKVPAGDEYKVSYSFPGKHGEYRVTTHGAAKVGKEIFDFYGPDTLSDGGGWGTNDPDAERVYIMPGIDVEKAVVVQLMDGTCLIAVRTK